MKNTLLAGAALAAVAGTAQAQTTFGNDCAGFSGLTPTIQANSNPIVGTPWQLQINGVPNGFGYLAIGFSNTSSLLGPLPIDLEALFVDPAWAGCDLNVSFDVALQTYFLNGSGVRAINFPSFPSGSIYFQWIGIDPDIVGFSKIAGVSQGIDMQGSVPSGVNPGDLVITEIFKDTSFAFDSEGEWIEILNTTGSAIDIEGFILSDDGSDSHTIDAGGAGVIVPAGGYVTLGINGDCALNGGVTHAYVYGGTNTFFLSNSDDEVVISDFNGIEIDRVDYDNGVTFPDTSGAALSLDPTKLNATDNDDGANWSSATCPMGQGCGLIYNEDTATPGADNGTCTTPPAPTPTGDLIFVEVMKNPAQADDDFAEWFEIYNTTGAAIDLDGYSFTSGAQVFTVSGTLVVPAGGQQLFMRDITPADNGGIDGALLGAYEYDADGGGNWNMGNGTETIQVFDALGGLVGQLTYDDTTFPDDSGVAFGLDPAVAYTQANAADGANWCNQTSTVPGGTDLGTPGAANDACVMAPGCLGTGEIICTEFMQNPSAVGDSAGEWLELYNTTGAPIDIEGWILRDNDSDSHTIDAGGAGVIVPAGGYIVLGNNGDSLSNGGVTVDYVYGTSWFLANSADEIVLENGSGIVFCVEYDNGTTFPDGNGASAALDPTKLDVLSATMGANWSLGTAPYGDGDLGTPGSAN